MKKSSLLKSSTLRDTDDTQSSSSKLYSGSTYSNTAASADDVIHNRCQTCRKNFILRRKITCQLCLAVFCSDHCTRKRTLNGAKELSSICDNCDLEETKKQITEEIDEEILKVTEELKEVRETNERLFREHVNKVSMVNDLDMEIKKQEWNMKKQEQDLQAILETEQIRGLKLRNAADNLRNTLDELNISEKTMSEQTNAAEFDLENTKLILSEVITQKEDLQAQIEKIDISLNESLSVEQVRKMLCKKCLEIVNVNIAKKKDECNY
ncbi:hypothetical protein SteCoe_15151 [Stentor coeruleus]|uniref:FYVE-type domain-containing protein n=1 Tax=Stentor coeruleus TaxID=5963 RepID=A0A1R2C4E1_9CILI|nr:hypothetical protein SteCoe_15151 [Stentor coeruleus]